MSYTTSCSTTRKDLDKATFLFSINKFAQAKYNKENGQPLESETFSIGASKFSLRMFPSGEAEKDLGFVSLFLMNASEHNVTVEYTLSIGSMQYSYDARVMKPGIGTGHTHFIKVSDVGLNMKAKADVTPWS